MSFHAVRSGDVHVGEDIVLVRRLTRPSATVRLTIHRFCQFRVDAAGLISDGAPGGVSLIGGGCGERLAQQRGQARLLRLRDTREQVSCRVNAAALPCPACRTLVAAAFRPSCASETTSFTPLRPRFMRLRRNSIQNTIASLSPIESPKISLLPSVLAATAIVAATLTVRSPWRTLRQVAPSQR